MAFEKLCSGVPALVQFIYILLPACHAVTLVTQSPGNPYAPSYSSLSFPAPSQLAGPALYPGSTPASSSQQLSCATCQGIESCQSFQGVIAALCIGIEFPGQTLHTAYHAGGS